MVTAPIKRVRSYRKPIRSKRKMQGKRTVNRLGKEFGINVRYAPRKHTKQYIGRKKLFRGSPKHKRPKADSRRALRKRGY